MKIKHLSSGQPLHLQPDAKIEVERTNPFLNEYTEQSIPLDIPADNHNRRLLEYPDVFGRIKKSTLADVSIQDGEFFAQCRQALLSATHHGMISTSFYLNDGSFYSKVANMKLKDVFTRQEDVVEFSGATLPDRVMAGIQFCRTLRNGNDERFRIFPVLLDDDSGLDTGHSHKMMNAFGKEQTYNAKSTFGNEPPQVTVFNPNTEGTGCDFYNVQNRTEYVNTMPITTSPGYYISPFIRATYVLQRVFSHFGYELQDCLFTTTAPFTDMVLVNNVIDVLVNGRIRVADLLPDITVLEFLTLWRRKFCCEFVTDENHGTASVVFLRDMVTAAPIEALTRCMTAEPTFQYKTEKDYKRIVLDSEEKVQAEVTDSYDDLKSLTADHPQVFFDADDGCFYKDGFSGNTLVHTKVGECSQSYNTGEDIDAQEVKIADCMPELRTLTYVTTLDEDTLTVTLGRFLYIGGYQTLNSKLVTANDDDDMDASDDSKKMKPMLAFAYLSNGKPEGTLSSYDIYASGHPRLWDYSLFYNGDDGIFERFYRDYDLLLRNSLHEVKVKLLLSQSQKMNMPATGKYVIRGVPFLIDKLKFVLGGKTDPAESTLRTLTLMEPVVSSPSLNDLLPDFDTGYVWIGKKTEEQVTESDYDNSGPDQNRVFSTVYPPVPTAELAGSRYGEQSSYYKQRGPIALWRHTRWLYTRITTWLECVPATSSEASDSGYHFGGRR